MLQLWLQTSFFLLTWDITGIATKVKVSVSVFFSLLTALKELSRVYTRGGLCGCVVALPIVFVLVHQVMKILFAFKCKDHMWNLTSGCVVYESSDELHANATASGEQVGTL